MQLYDRNFPADWMPRMGEPEIWQGIHNVDPGELWETHYALKNLLLAFVRRRREPAMPPPRRERRGRSKRRATCSIRTC